MFIVVAYAPTENASVTEKDSFYNQLEPLILSTPRHDQLFIVGDLNAVNGTESAWATRPSSGATVSVFHTITRTVC